MIDRAQKIEGYEQKTARIANAGFGVIQQSYKDRAAALRFLRDHGYTKSERTFYGDCDKHDLLEPDGKTILLCSLLAYFWRVYPPVAAGRQTSDDVSDLSAAREAADTRKAVAAADREEMKRDQEQRELDKQWIKREDADLETCTWTALTRDQITNRLGKSLPTLIHAVAGKLDRLADGQAVIDQAVTDACNDISNSGEVDVDFEDVEEIETV